MNLGYALIMLLAIVLGWAISRRTQQSLPMTGYQKLGIVWGGFVGAMIAAKLPFLFDDWNALLDGSAWLVSGKTILMGLVGGYLGVELAKWALDVRGSTGDTFVLPVACAIAVGRLGCFHVGCCFGLPTNLPWAVVFPNVDQQPRHPTQLYEFGFHLIMVAFFCYCQRRHWFEQQQFKLYVMLYAIYRFATETIRPEAIGWGGLTAYQWGSLAILVLFGLLWYRDQRLGASRRPPLPA